MFDVNKTSFIHFVRPLQPHSKQSSHLVFGGKTIAPKGSVKILGITLDSRLTMDEHVSKVVARAMDKCKALRRIRGVRPAQMRQLYTAAVVPTTDYEPSRIGVKRHVVRARESAATRHATDPAGIQVGFDARVAERGQVGVGE